MKRFFLIIAWFVIGMFLLLAGSLTGSVSAQTMPPTSTADRLKRPPTVYPPTQADDGHQVYHMVCMVCHGDEGQGLTEEWRAALDLEDQDCWQSGCHHTRHPPGGFIFPKVVPRIVGGGALARFNTALDLYQYLSTKMPWQAPGYLKDEEYWQLTAYLLRENQVDLANRTLTLENAAQVPVRPPQQSAKTGYGIGQIWPYLAAAGLVFLMLAAWGLAKIRKA